VHPKPCKQIGINAKDECFYCSFLPMFYFGGEFLSHGAKKFLTNGLMDLSQKI
jgi:hypothetical protein